MTDQVLHDAAKGNMPLGTLCLSVTACSQSESRVSVSIAQLGDFVVVRKVLKAQLGSYPVLYEVDIAATLLLLSCNGFQLKEVILSKVKSALIC